MPLVSLDFDVSYSGTGSPGITKLAFIHMRQACQYMAHFCRDSPDPNLFMMLVGWITRKNKSYALFGRVLHTSVIKGTQLLTTAAASELSLYTISMSSSVILTSAIISYSAVVGGFELRRISRECSQ